MLGAMKRTGSKAAYEHWNKNLPVLLICGEKDPVGNMGKGASTVRKRMAQGGLQNVTFHLLRDARHMILSEEACGAAADARRILLEWLLN